MLSTEILIQPIMHFLRKNLSKRCGIWLTTISSFRFQIKSLYLIEGHAVVVIEHHMAVVAEADWVLDIGPEAGAAGGTLVAQGTPETVAKSKKSRTAPFLSAALGG